MNNDHVYTSYARSLVALATSSPLANILERGPRIAAGGPTQDHYELVLDALATIRLQKVAAYGTSRYKPESARYNLSLAYGDLERKMIRIKHQLFSGQQLSEQVVSDQVMEAAADLANYAVLMVQLCMILLAENLCEDIPPFLPETKQ